MWKDTVSGSGDVVLIREKGRKGKEKEVGEVTLEKAIARGGIPTTVPQAKGCEGRRRREAREELVQSHITTGEGRKRYMAG